MEHYNTFSTFNATIPSGERKKKKKKRGIGTVLILEFRYWICETKVRIPVLEYNFEQFSCIQKQKIHDEILGWFVYTVVQLALLSLS